VKPSDSKIRTGKRSSESFRVTAPRPRAVVLLGAQRFQPTLGEAVAELGVKGKIATITAGWQEREAEDDDLDEHLGARAVNLMLHQRGEEVFRDDAELHEAHRERQEVLRHRQDFYRIRLEHELDAQHVIRQRAAPAAILDDEREASIDAIRELDTWHLGKCTAVRNAFEEKMAPSTRPVVQKHLAELRAIVRECDAIAIGGGHVATLLNRLMLFRVADLVETRVVFAWCAGAMAVSDRVVLFHDNPPQGPGAAEVLDAGMGLVPGTVVLPQPEDRLRLDDAARVQVMAHRFSPDVCLAFPARSRITWKNRRFTSVHGVIGLMPDGEAAPLVTPGAAS
jgi:hypothetical protein